MNGVNWYHEQLLVAPMVLEEQSPDEVLNRLGSLLYGAGYVKRSYVPAILEREKVYPTALPTTVGVAVPHTDAQHVLNLSMAVGILTQPVPFKEMGSNGERQVDVRVVMALAIPRPDEVVNMLRHLFSVIQVQDFLPYLISTQDRNTLSVFLNERINLSLGNILSEKKADSETIFDGDWKTITLKVTHPVGLHARPASLFVKTAKGFKADIKLICGEKQANAKSILNVLQLGAGQGSFINIYAHGIDEDQALSALRELVESDFGGVE